MQIDQFLPIIIIFWIIRIVLNLTFHIQRWYIKEYRFDRMLIYIKVNPLVLFLPKVTRMRISPKTVFLFILSIFAFLGIGFLLKTDILVKLLLIDLTQFGLISICVILVNIPTYIFHNLIILRAKRKLLKYSKLKVIGITGSFGKTSTKEFLKILLSEKYLVQATIGSKNSPIGIAEVILKNLKPTDQVFIVEMGAYKRGEIKEICKLVKPQMGIITGINEQHIELFGSIANTRKAKYELVESIPKDNQVFFNADNEYTRLMAKQTKNKEVILFGTHKNAYVRIENIKQTTQKLNFTVYVGKHIIKADTNVLGKHYVVNIAAAIAVASKMNLSLGQIQAGLAKLKPPATSLHKTGDYKGAVLIDDTFNANPDSVKAAVDYLTTYAGRKYLVFTPLIELGEKASSIHFELGKYCSQHIDELILTNRTFANEIRKGIAKNSPNLKFQILSTNKISSYLQKSLTSKDAVVFEGKEAMKSLKKLLQNER